MSATSPVQDSKQDDPEILLKIANLSLEPNSESVLIPFTAADLELWRDYAEYRENRKHWNAFRQEDWTKHHPPQVHEFFNNTPVLETSRLRIRLLRSSDTESAFRVLSNERAMKYYGTPPHKDVEYTRKQYVDIMVSRFKARDAAVFVVTFKDKDEYIGHVSAISFDRVFKFCEIAYVIDPENWGKGIATEAVGRVVNYLMTDVGIHKIRAGLFAKNLASKRVLEKLNFVQEGYLRDNVIIDDEYVDEYVMALIAKR